MNYQISLEKSIQEAKLEFESIIENLINTKKEYNDIKWLKANIEKALEKKSLEISIKSLELQEVETRIEDARGDENRLHTAKKRSYELEERKIELARQKYENEKESALKILKNAEEKTVSLEEREQEVSERERKIKERENDLDKKYTLVWEKEWELSLKERRLEQSLTSHDWQVQRDKQFCQNLQLGIALREKNLKDREKKVITDTEHIRDQWKQLKQADEHLQLKNA